MIDATVEIPPTIDEQIRRCNNFDKVAASEFVPAMRTALGVAEGDVRSTVPVLSGYLASTIEGKIKYIAGENVRGVIYADARVPSAKYPQGFPYGYALDASPKYTSGGRKTKGWLKGVLRRKRAEINAPFAAAVGRIVNRLMVNNG